MEVMRQTREVRVWNNMVVTEKIKLNKTQDATNLTLSKILNSIFVNILLFSKQIMTGDKEHGSLKSKDSSIECKRENRG